MDDDCWDDDEDYQAPVSCLDPDLPSTSTASLQLQHSSFETPPDDHCALPDDGVLSSAKLDATLTLLLSKDFASATSLYDSDPRPFVEYAPKFTLGHCENGFHLPTIADGEATEATATLARTMAQARELVKTYKASPRAKRGIRGFRLAADTPDSPREPRRARILYPRTNSTQSTPPSRPEDMPTTSTQHRTHIRPPPRYQDHSFTLLSSPSPPLTEPTPPLKRAAPSEKEPESITIEDDDDEDYPPERVVVKKRRYRRRSSLLSEELDEPWMVDEGLDRLQGILVPNHNQELSVVDLVHRAVTEIRRQSRKMTEQKFVLSNLMNAQKSLYLRLCANVVRISIGNPQSTMPTR